MWLASVRCDTVQHSKRLTTNQPIFGELSCAALGSSSRARKLLAGLQRGTAEIWKSVAPDNHLGSFIELVGGAGNSATITLPDGL